MQSLSQAKTTDVHGMSTMAKKHTYKRLYVLPNSYARLYVLPNLYVRSYVLPILYVRLYVSLFVQIKQKKYVV